jgi:aerotaxis receptor
MNRQTAPLSADTGREAPFTADELIYSRTDDRGVILAGNEVFQRLSGQDWRELIGAPHRIIRHPDMPKGFFHLFWQQLKNGEPAVGYVKNRSKDGGHYWVLANAIPCPGGYFSIRMKPSSPLFDKVREEYAALVDRERREDLTAQASAQILLERLGQMGFADYTQFMSSAAEQEVQFRNQALGRPQDSEAHHISAIVDLLHEALEIQARLVAGFRDLMLLPVNMRLVAARLEPQGGPISQISMNYKSAADEIAARLGAFVTGDRNLCRRMAVATRNTLVLNHFAHLQTELLDNYDRIVPGYTGPERRTELQAMTEVKQFCLSRAKAAITEASHLAVGLTGAAADVRRMILGLDTIRILGRVESRRDLASETSMSATIDQIDSVQAEISVSLKRLTDLTAAIHSGLLGLGRPAGAAQRAVAAE